ncbi:hypothetical protein OVN18_00150 [Microcella daejeonensis]|uniref:Uncharacterized protein n=1 Tax=Microcella daejeonensis TaxID=2994971 RepID=A0A9E8ML44_9MICO|nr:hypothetical protein [Microcella daejeonensis]WAB81479.1 hypothetical protein OVN18_00150 [Microcella daejeonensis]
MTRDAAAESARIAELQRLAYGRASTPAEAARAEAAALELQQLLAARAAAEHPTPTDDRAAAPPADAHRADAADVTDVTDAPDDDAGPRPWWQRLPALVGALAAAIVGGGALLGVLTPSGPPAALVVFDRAPDAAELALTGRFQQLGAPVDGLRIIGDAGAAELVAFRAPTGTAQQLADAAGAGEPSLPLVDESRFGENGEPVRESAEQDVCLMVVDRGLPSGTSCASVGDFVERGLEVEGRDALSGAPYRGSWLADGSVTFEPLP